jgi:hypothetical protein
VTLLNAPQVAPLQLEPESAQVTPLFCVSLETVTVKFLVVFTFTVAEGGTTLTLMAGVTVIAAVAVLVPSAIDVAVSVTAFGEGAFAGAVYVTEVVVRLESEPQAAPEQPAPESVQLTPLFCVSFWRVTEKFCVPRPP